jgi:hypothetical protein
MERSQIVTSAAKLDPGVVPDEMVTVYLASYTTFPSDGVAPR